MQDFKKDIEGYIKPAIGGLGVGFGNLFKGMGGIMQDFMPHMDSISARMQRITKRFADWGTGLKGSPEFERFLSYSSEMAPLLAETFGDIGSAFMKDRKSTRLNSSHVKISYAVFCLKKKKKSKNTHTPCTK